MSLSELSGSVPEGSEEKHSHRWRIDTPNGKFSKGACACGAERHDFRNSSGDSFWEERQRPDKGKNKKPKGEKRYSLRTRRTTEEKISALDSTSIAALQLIANGVSAQEIQGRLNMTSKEYLAAWAKCASAGVGGYILYTIRTAIHEGAIVLTEQPDFEVELTSDEENFLGILTDPIRLDRFAKSRDKTTKRVLIECYDLLQKIGADNVYHATAIMEDRAMRIEALDSVG